MAIEFHPLAQRLGFDPDAVPQWQMVPAGGTRIIRVTDVGAHTLSSSNPGILRVNELVRAAGTSLVSLHGLRDGTAQLHVKNGAAIAARLDVDVKRKRTVRTAFNFVADNAGHRTARGLGTEDNLIRRANAILTPQANVEITKHRARNVTVPKNLRRVIRFSSHLRGIRARQHEWDDVVAQGDATADINVFFVWEYEQDRTPHVDNTEGAALGTDVLMDDDVGDDAHHHGDHVTLAHEIGHVLGVDHTAVAQTKFLLSPGSVRSDVFISKGHANTMNP